MSLLVAALPATAQQEADPAAKPYNDLVKAQRGLKTKLALESGEIDDKKAVDDYLDATFRLWVHPLHVDKIHKTRQLDLKVPLGKAGNAGSDDLHAYLLVELMKRLPPLVQDDKQPVPVRLNAILLLGDLNTKELATGGTGDAAPMIEALPVLIQALTATDDDAVRVGAMVGLLRHAQSKQGIKDKVQLAAVTDAMLQTLAQEQPPDGRPAEAHLWMRRRAAAVLAALGAPGTDAQPLAVLDALAAAIDDADAPLVLRAAAARGLNGLNLQGAQGVNYSRLAASLGQLAVEVTEQDLSRRGLRRYLNEIETALNGPHAQQRAASAAAAEESVGGLRKLATGTEHADYVNGVWGKFNEMIKFALDPDNTDEAVADEMTDLGESLATWLEENAPAGEPVAAN